MSSTTTRRGGRSERQARHARPERGRPDARRRAPRGFGRFLGSLAVWLLLWWSVLGALLAPVVPGGWWGVALLAVVTTAPLAAIILGFRRHLYPGALFRLFVLRPFCYAQLLLPVLGAAGVVGVLLGLPFGAAGAGGRWAVAVAAAISAAAILAGYVGSRRLVRTDVTASWPDLPEALDGLRIGQLSDVHVGPHTSRAHLARAARLVSEAAPDLVVVTGDLIDDHAPDVAHYGRAFGALAAPLGVFAIPGNHDVYADWPAVRAGLERLPLTLLVNEHRVVERSGARLAVVGTGDPAGRGNGAGPDVVAALAGVPDDAFVLALAHNPALWPALADRGVSLTLSGHTHWGQFAVPSLGWSLASPFLEHAMGTHAREDSLLYIHPGTNYWGIPFRLGTPPEVAVVTLRRGALGIERRVVRG